MNLLNITDATMAAALTTTYDGLFILVDTAGELGNVDYDQALAEEAQEKLEQASRQLNRYLNGKNYLPDEDGEAADLSDLIEYATAVTAREATWESYIADARDA